MVSGKRNIFGNRYEFQSSFVKTIKLCPYLAVCVSGLYVGCGLGYVIPPAIVTGPTDQSQASIIDNDVFNETSKWNEDQFEEVQFQIIWMHSVSFGIALMTMIALGVLYNKDKDGAPNMAEARRLSIGTIDRPLL